jgi:hypothetical protein
MSEHQNIKTDKLSPLPTHPSAAAVNELKYYADSK